jgi:hypothetical protein
VILIKGKRGGLWKQRPRAILKNHRDPGNPRRGQMAKDTTSNVSKAIDLKRWQKSLKLRRLFKT